MHVFPQANPQTKSLVSWTLVRKPHNKQLIELIYGKAFRHIIACEHEVDCMVGRSKVTLSAYFRHSAVLGGGLCR